MLRRRLSRVPRLRALVTASIVLFAAAPQAQETPPITPADVFQQVSILRAELELIRVRMGGVIEERPELEVSNVGPHEVYFQAEAVFATSDQLLFEQTKRRIEAQPFPTGEIRPAHVFGVITASLSGILKVKAVLGLEASIDPIEHEASRTPTDVFRSAVQVKRQLNRLLQEKIEPTDVFRRVTESIARAARLMEVAGIEERIPDPPAFVAGRRPADVYQRLARCFGLVQAIAKQNQVSVLTIAFTETSAADILPSDVYDLASLLLSELAAFHRLSGNKGIVPSAYSVGPRTPSDVYQRAGILERQLTALHAFGTLRPGWVPKATGAP